MSTTTAPQLLFDDGSRAIQQESSEVETVVNPRGDIPIREYYEIDRLLPLLQPYSRIALQFPDALLSDAPSVCQLLQQSNNQLIFCLGDTTLAPCCPDVVAAQHLQADALVHYGHACLTPCRVLPVYYSFGRTAFNVEACVEQLVHVTTKVLILYAVESRHAVQALAKALREKQVEDVVVGELPEVAHPERVQVEGCGTSEEGCGCRSQREQFGDEALTDNEPTLIGGLRVPDNVDWSQYTILYLGDETSRQYMNIVLRLLSVAPSPTQFYRFHHNQLSTELSPRFQKLLNKRFYCVQKIRHASVFGLLVARLTPESNRIVHSLRKLLQDRSTYTLVVGKLNPAKLANFAEMECFVMVACPEHSLLDDDREYHVPIVTPLEVQMALGVVEWGSVPYETNWVAQREAAASHEDDEPYFSVVTGRMESRPASTLESAPGQGQLTMYNSAAANFLKTREYQGLDATEEAEVRAAIPGQTGIASNYDDR